MVHSTSGRGAPCVPAAAGRLRAEDAAGRPGRLPQGRRGDPGARGRRARVPRPGGRDGLGLAHAGAVPGHRARGPGGLLRAAREFQDGGGRNIESFFGKRAGLARAPRGRRPRRRRDRRGLRPRVLDLPEPWDVARAARDACCPAGAIFCGYLPTTNQIQTARARVGGAGYEQIETFEVLHPLVARHRAQRPAGPPDGRAHRVHHARASRLSDRLDTGSGDNL